MNRSVHTKGAWHKKLPSIRRPLKYSSRQGVRRRDTSFDLAGDHAMDGACLVRYLGHCHPFAFGAPWDFSAAAGLARTNRRASESIEAEALRRKSAVNGQRASDYRAVEVSRQGS